MSPLKPSMICASCTVILTLWFMALPRRHLCTAFQMETSKPYTIITLQRSTRNSLMRLADNSNEDFPSLSDDEGLIEGRQLADKFYDDLKRRAAASPTSDVSTETYEISRSTSSAKPIRKFTGKSSPASVFDSKSTDRAPSANVQREREREFNLASIFERTFPIQAAALLAFTIFVSLVGFSGDITDGSDRNFYGDDDLIEETVVEQLERIRTDDAREVTGKIWI